MAMLQRQAAPLRYHFIPPLHNFEALHLRRCSTGDRGLQLSWELASSHRVMRVNSCHWARRRPTIEDLRLISQGPPQIDSRHSSQQAGLSTLFNIAAFIDRFPGHTTIQDDRSPSPARDQTFVARRVCIDTVAGTRTRWPPHLPG